MCSESKRERFKEPNRRKVRCAFISCAKCQDGQLGVIPSQLYLVFNIRASSYFALWSELSTEHAEMS